MLCWVQAANRKPQICVSVCEAAIFKQQVSYFLPACSCLCCSWTPSTAWWKSNTAEEGEREHTLSRTSESRAHTFARSAHMHSYLDLKKKKVSLWVPGMTYQYVLCLRWSTFSPSLLNLHTHIQKHTQTHNTTLSLHILRHRQLSACYIIYGMYEQLCYSPFPLLWFFSASSNRPGRWITTPFPEEKKRKKLWLKLRFTRRISSFPPLASGDNSQPILFCCELLSFEDIQSVKISAFFQI